MADRLASIRTPWTDIILAQQGEPSMRLQCIQMLAEKYHEPIKTYVEHALHIHQPYRIDELVQGYFHKFLAKNFLERVQKDLGSLRGFFMSTVRSYVQDEIDRGKSNASYGPFAKHSSLNISDNVPDKSTHTPEELFMIAWARDFMADVVDAFRAECLDHGKRDYFDVFEQQVLRPDEFGQPSYEDTAKALGMDKKRVSNCLQNAKHNFNTMLRNMVRASVTDETMVDSELADLEKYLRL